MALQVRIAVCEHGVGNVRSVVRAIEYAAPGATVLHSNDPEVVRGADRIVVPGQGSFGAIVKALDGGLRDALVAALRAGTPYLGICLGLQILFDESDEAPGVRGLGVFRGRVRRLEVPLPLPHMGWNAVEPRGTGIERLGALPAHFYFAHSYVAVPEEPDIIAATTDYGGPFVSAVARGNVLGVQFHPEKSQREGLGLLRRFFA